MEGSHSILSKRSPSMAAPAPNLTNRLLRLGAVWLNVV